MARNEDNQERRPDRSQGSALSSVSGNGRMAVATGAPIRSRAASDRLAATLEELGASGEVVRAAKRG